MYSRNNNILLTGKQKSWEVVDYFPTVAQKCDFPR